MEPHRPQDRPDTLAPGTRIGEFEIEQVVGAGGFGVVYRAFDHALERHVALKEYMPASLAVRRGVSIAPRSGAHADSYGVGLRSFVNEARLLARFDHPALVRVYRFWEEHGTAYMVMPFCEGQTLSAARDAMSGPPSDAWLRALVEPLLGALDTLHREQVYHRDVAPDNILLLPEGGPLLLDFGAARRVLGDETQALTAIVKPNFAAIEQYAESSRLRQGPWTDLYGLGAVLYYCLIGRAPPPAAARALHDELVPLARLQSELRATDGSSFSPELLAAVDAALAVRPHARPQHATAFAALLRGETPTVWDAVAVEPSRERVDVSVPTQPTPFAPTVTLGQSGGGGWRARWRILRAAFAWRRRPLEMPKSPAHAALAARLRLRARQVRRPLFSAIGVAGLVSAALLAYAATRDEAAATVREPSVRAAAPQPLPARIQRPAEPAPPAPAAVVVDKPAARSPSVAAVRAPAPKPAALPAAPSETAAAPVAADPRLACGDRNFLSMQWCLKRLCGKPAYEAHGECERLREQEVPRTVWSPYRAQ